MESVQLYNAIPANAVLIDMREKEDYAAGHIPGALLIPNESIETERPGLLPDPEQIILVYCRSGRRSNETAAWQSI